MARVKRSKPRARSVMLPTTGYALVMPDGTIALGPSNDRTFRMLEIYSAREAAEEARKVHRAVAEYRVIPKRATPTRIAKVYIVEED